MTTTPTSKGEDRTVSSGSKPDSAPDTVTDAVQPEDDEGVQDTEAGGGTDFKVAGGSDSAGSSAVTSTETVTDLRVVDSTAESHSTDQVGSDPAWAAAAEPGGSVYAGRTDPPAPVYTPPAPPPMTPSASPSSSGEHPNVIRGAKAADGKSPRKAHLQVSRFEPLSVMKFSFVMSLVCFVVLLVAVTVLYVILSTLGVFDSISSTINELTQEQGSKSSSFDASSWFSFTKIFGYTALIGGLNVLIITALSTVWSVIYNIAADFVGGVEVTLKEAE